MVSREKYEQFENERLAPYAQKSSDTKGRRYPEPKHPLRTEYQRDRERIVHCRAFRRLEYKTQVFVNSEGDHYRTRLTHTMEVAQIGRSIARILGLNEDLTEAIGLVHDVGHPPFGHTGESALNDLMADHGGFEHNLQSLRVVDELELKYPDFMGINLTWEVREGIMKHRTEYDHTAYSADGLRNNPTLEAQIVDLADEIAYSTHDIDDGLGSGLITEKMLMELAIWNKSNSRFFEEYPNADQEIVRYYSVRNLISYLVGDLIASSTATIDGNRINSPDGARDFETALIRFGPRVQQEMRLLKDFLYNKMYLHPRVHEKNEKARKVIAHLFEYFLENPEKLSAASRKRFGVDPDYRVVCDYIAGMTDRYALMKYTEFTGEELNLNIIVL